MLNNNLLDLYLLANHRRHFIIFRPSFVVLGVRKMVRTDENPVNYEKRTVIQFSFNGNKSALRY